MAAEDLDVSSSSDLEMEVVKGGFVVKLGMQANREMVGGAEAPATWFAWKQLFIQNGFVLGEGFAGSATPRSTR